MAKHIYNNYVNKKVIKQYVNQFGGWLLFSDGSVVQIHDFELEDNKADNHQYQNDIEWQNNVYLS